MTPESWTPFAGLHAGFGARSHGPQLPPGIKLVRTIQVHGRRLVDASEVGARTEADGILVTTPGLAATISTADCVPILLCAARAPSARGVAHVGWAAAVHAGWRGTAIDIVSAAVRAAEAAGFPPASVRAALGPAIGPCCYTVGEEVADRFLESDLPVARLRDRSVLDLREINTVLLARAGVPPRNIAQYGPCTRCHSDRYYSYRADPSDSGRQLNWIGWA
jgi:YfiH family protein